MRRPLAIGLLVGLVAVGAAGCSRDRLRPGEARLEVSGRALVTERGKAATPVTGSRRIRFGDTVKLTEGSARVRSAEGRDYELRCRADACTELLVDGSPSLGAGELLVTAGQVPVVVRTAGSEVEVAGAARVARSLAVSATAYRGDVVLRSGGRTFTVRGLRQASVPAIGVLPTAATPLAYDDADEWDRRFLGAAMAVGRELDSRSRAFGPNVRTSDARTSRFYAQLVPGLDDEPGFDGALLDANRPAGETLVGAVLAVSGRQGGFVDRWRSVFGFRDEGASWGLVALDQGVVEGADVVGKLDLAIGRAPLRFADASPAQAAAPSTTPTTERPRSDGGGSTTTTTRPRTPTTTTPTTQPGPVPPVTTTTPLDPIVEPVVDTLNGLLEPLP